MPSKRGCSRSTRRGLTARRLVLGAMWIALVPLTAWAGAARSVVRQQEPVSREDTSGIQSAFTAPEAVPLKKPVLYPRTPPFWGLATGPTYGYVPAEASRNPDVIVLRVGSFVTSGPGLPVPGDLRAAGRA